MSIEINAKDVMKLRNETGLSMMECKKAMVEVGGDVEKAKDLLRKTMKGKMDAKMDRAAGEGRIAIAINEGGGVAVIVEVRCETDFTATNPQFIAANAAALGTPTPVPCMPITTPWTPGAPKTLINHFPALTMGSMCMCAWGPINIVNPGTTKEMVT